MKQANQGYGNYKADSMNYGNHLSEVLLSYGFGFCACKQMILDKVHSVFLGLNIKNTTVHVKAAEVI